MVKIIILFCLVTVIIFNMVGDWGNLYELRKSDWLALILAVLALIIAAIMYVYN